MVAVVVEFDKLEEGRVFRVGEQLVDDHAAQRAGAEDLILPGRPAGGVADVPGPRIALAIGGIGQDQRMPGAAGRHRPWIHIRVRNRQQDCPLVIQQLQCVGFLQAAGVWADDIGDAIDVLDALRRCHRHQKGAAGQDCPRRKRVGHASTDELEPADVLEVGIGIVEFDELEVVAIGARRGFVHDFGNDDRGQAAARAKWFMGVRERIHRGASDVAEVTKLGRGGEVGVVAAHRQADIYLGRHGNRRAAQ